MIVTIDKQSKTPLYCQIADWVERRITSGELREGERLPSERSLCAATGASRDTVKRAYRELERRGCISIGRGSGSYVKKQDLQNIRKQARLLAENAVGKLKNSGLTRHETELAFLDLMWARLPESEKLEVAWVDCSAEILHDTAGELEKNCNVRVTPFLLEEVEADPGPLLEAGFDLIATTINHIDDLMQALIQKTGSMPKICMEKVVLAISRMTVSQLARIEEEMEVVAAYETEWYRSNMVRFLDEFSVNGKKRLIRLEDTLDYLKHSKRKNAVILPQDFGYLDGLVGDIWRYCEEHGIFCIVCHQIIDGGSMLHFRKRLQRKWLEGIEHGGIPGNNSMKEREKA